MAVSPENTDCIDVIGDRDSRQIMAALKRADTVLALAHKGGAGPIGMYASALALGDMDGKLPTVMTPQNFARLGLALLALSGGGRCDLVGTKGVTEGGMRG